MFKPTMREEAAIQILKCLYYDEFKDKEDYDAIVEEKIILLKENGFVQKTPVDEVDELTERLSITAYERGYYEEHKQVIDSFIEERKLYLKAIEYLKHEITCHNMVCNKEGLRISKYDARLR